MAKKEKAIRYDDLNAIYSGPVPPALERELALAVGAYRKEGGDLPNACYFSPLMGHALVALTEHRELWKLCNLRLTRTNLVSVGGTDVNRVSGVHLDFKFAKATPFAVLEEERVFVTRTGTGLWQLKLRTGFNTKVGNWTYRLYPTGRNKGSNTQTVSDSRAAVAAALTRIPESVHKEFFAKLRECTEAAVESAFSRRPTWSTHYAKEVAGVLRSVLDGVSLDEIEQKGSREARDLVQAVRAAWEQQAIREETLASSLVVMTSPEMDVGAPCAIVSSTDNYSSISRLVELPEPLRGPLSMVKARLKNQNIRASGFSIPDNILPGVGGLLVPPDECGERGVILLLRPDGGLPYDQVRASALQVMHEGDM